MRLLFGNHFNNNFILKYSTAHVTKLNINWSFFLASNRNSFTRRDILSADVHVILLKRRWRFGSIKPLMRLHWREMKLSLRGEKTLDLEQRNS